MLKILLLCLNLAQAMDGTATSGGGGAFVKRSPIRSGPVESAILVDLWEAEHIPFAWPHKTGTVAVSDPGASANAEVLVGDWLTRLNAIDPSMAAQVQEDYLYVRSHVNPLPPDVMIALPDDLKLQYYPTGYTPEGMMRFNGLTGMLDVNEEIFGRLASPLHTAAAWMHEALYKTLRESIYAHKTSVMARHLNACLFSSEPACLAPRRLELPNDRWVFRCSTDSADYYIYPLSNVAPYDLKGYRIEFTRLLQALPSPVYQEAKQVLYNPDGSKLGASGGALTGPFAAYSFASGTAVVELMLNARGELQGSILRSARSSLRGGFDLLPNGSETAHCQQEVLK